MLVPASTLSSPDLNSAMNGNSLAVKSRSTSLLRKGHFSQGTLRPVVDASGVAGTAIGTEASNGVIKFSHYNATQRIWFHLRSAFQLDRMLSPFFALRLLDGKDRASPGSSPGHALSFADMANDAGEVAP